jgi:hypothetical protein
MPEISRFYGITIRVNFSDHSPPHFHAQYAEHEAVIDVNSLAVMEGRLPTRARRLVMEWALLHQEELLQAWSRAQRHESPGRIAPLE